MSHSIRPYLCALSYAVFAATITVAASAESPPSARTPQFDRHHDYPPRGHVVPRLPLDHHVSSLRGTSYYYHGGVWYRPQRSHWVVISPPVGLLIPFLPSFYTTLWVDGAPYYYANEVYYAWRPALGGYVIVEPPRKTAAVSAQPRISEIYVYPKNDQNADRQATDRYECHRWALTESSFDPTQPLGGVSVDQSNEKRADYFRALTACLEGRGYSVK